MTGLHEKEERENFSAPLIAHNNHSDGTVGADMLDTATIQVTTDSPASDDGSDTETAKTNSQPLFSKAQRRISFSIVLLSQILNQGSFNASLPALPAIREDFDTSITLTNTTAAMQLLMIALLSAVWGSYADGYGRRIVFTISNTVLVFGNLGSALAINIGMLIAFRLISSIGYAASSALGTGIIADVFDDNERGSKFSWYASLTLYAAACAPALGGVMTQHLGWRSIFWFIFASYVVLWLSIFFFLPETNPRVRKLPSIDSTKVTTEEEKSRKKVLNPFVSLKFLLLPNVVLPCLYLGLMGFTGYAANITFTWAYSEQYGFDSSMVGVFFLFGIIGITAGGILGGKLSDRIYSRRVQKANANNREVYPEMRLSQTWVIIGAFAMAASFVTFGWAIEKNLHYSVGLVCLALVQFGVMLETCLLSVYAVQSYPKHGSSVQACFQVVKYVLFFFGTLWATDLQNLLGAGVLYTVLSSILLITSPFVTYIQRNRERWRKAANSISW
ncbi:major facilitator superfamily domain-containing protein [Fennellomyces sp. T-0311]|nr:major facilitator superfamily domain-containing protein [Fennellomyces sp. T-0311]